MVSAHECANANCRRRRESKVLAADEVVFSVEPDAAPETIRRDRSKAVNVFAPWVLVQENPLVEEQSFAVEESLAEGEGLAKEAL